MNQRHFDTLDAWSKATAQHIAAVLRNDIAEHSKTSFAVPGGRTAIAVLPVLAKLNLDWNRITVTLVDERWVAPDHPDSNERLARDLLGTNVTSLYTADATPEAGLAEATGRIETLLPLGCALLGMGEDGHIASLFPGAKAQDNILQTAQRADHPRISMTPKTLLSAREIVLAVSGPEKRAQIDRALQPGAADALPVRYVLVQNQTPVSVFTS